MRFSACSAVSAFLLLTLLLHAGAACANVNQRRQQIRPRTPLEEFFQRFDRSWTIGLSSDRRRVANVVGNRTRPYAGEPRQKTLQFLSEHIQAFGLAPRFIDLRFVDVKVTDSGAHVEMQQTFRGLPVENGRIKVNFDRDGRVVQFASSYMPPVRPLQAYRLGQMQAVQIAIAEFLRRTPIFESKLAEQQNFRGRVVTQGSMQLRQRPRIEPVFFIRQDSLHPAFKVFISAQRPFGIKEIVVDATDGRVMQTSDFVFTSVDARGQVFIPNPVNSLNNSRLRDNLPLPTEPNPYHAVLLPGVQQGVSLQGPFVVLRDIEPPANVPPISTSPFNFIFERNVTSFQEVMVYYHISRNQLYVQSLGFRVLDRPIWADAHGYNGEDYSKYVSDPTPIGHGFLVFGDGGVDDAEDGDIIVHEYGHALQDEQARGKYAVSGQPKAMAEGFGDYWAFSSFYRETCASGHDRHCIGEWDKVPYCLRKVNSNTTANDYDDRLGPHTNGLIWSRTLLDIFNTFGKTVTDRLILKSHYNVLKGPSFRQAADAIIAADMQLFQGANVPELCRVFRLRNIYNSADCSFPPTQPITIPPCTF